MGGGGDGVEKMNERGRNLLDVIKEEVGGGAGRGEGVEEEEEKEEGGDRKGEGGEEKKEGWKSR